MSALVRYDAMCSAIAECHRIDDAKDIADKALALVAYARKANDPALERQVAEIRLHARRRLGELSAALDSGQGANQHRSSGGTKHEALAAAGLSKTEAHRCEQIWIAEGQILDGRNRWRAAQAAGVECPSREYTGDAPAAFVVSLNLHRRHLNESQRAIVAAKLATLEDGQRSDHVEGLPIGRASELLGVGERTVARARVVAESQTPAIVGE